MMLGNLTSNKIFFSGIGGVSMNALALILQANGYQVTGSDRSASPITDRLVAAGIPVFIGQTAENITPDLGLVVRTAAVPMDAPEIVRAMELGIPVMERCTLLGIVMKNYQNRINVSGTHGKTTTTSMTALALMKAGVEPTVTVGGDFPQIDGNLLLGKRDYFVCEACEYVESFLEFFPSATILLNIEEDHLDYYRDIVHIRSAFQRFVEKTEQLMVANGDDPNVRLLDFTNTKTVFFGLESGDYLAKNVVFYPDRTEYDAVFHGEPLAHVVLTVPGAHNVLNSLAVFALCRELGLPKEPVLEALCEFGGAKRRMEYKGQYQSVPVYDDYAHHPTEIETTISSLRQKNPKRLVMLFQPHTYTRTKTLKDDFIRVLKEVDAVYLLDIYAAREKDTGEISSRDLAEQIPGCFYTPTMAEALRELEAALSPGDVFVTVGAGDVYRVGEALLETKKGDLS
ncbi:MAG: UDP-N-acetylmuramate--L-alanine ligase [Clostridia bacterium]|nr:UDP-N-acetylmuramate--L-alanine ligase [Clostridia bacterium]